MAFFVIEIDNYGLLFRLTDSPRSGGARPPPRAYHLKRVGQGRGNVFPSLDVFLRSFLKRN